MWFRNLSLYRLGGELESDPVRLNEQLQAQGFLPCGGLDTYREGWTPPLGKHGEQLVHTTNGRLMLCLRHEERILPAAVVREALDEKVERIETAEARPVGRKERARLRDELVTDLLPRAFTRSQLTFGYIDPAAGWVVIDTATTKRAEAFLNLLRESLGSLKVRPLTVNHSPPLSMTRWLEGGLPQQFIPGDECELREPVENGAVIRVRRLDLAGEDVHTHLDAGMQVTRLAVEWTERVRCVIGDDLTIRRLRFTDLVLDDAADIAADDNTACFDADFALMSGELSQFIPALIQAFGGIEED